MDTDRSIEELVKRCGEEWVTVECLSVRLPGFVYLNPGCEVGASSERAGALG
ncbi:DUF6104 family protein [Streptomyces sp. NBC_00658]|uniref:DUF6104 family protein n=1 Tax=Streptomyces sp. NBC_00658 TaxID=2975800 RepID=UPI00386B6CEC